MKNQDKDTTVDADYRILELCSGALPGAGPFWALIGFSPENHAAWRHARKANKNVNIPSLGEVLKAGWGKKPSTKQIRELRQEYNIDEKFLDNVKVEILRLTGMGICA